MLKEVRANCFFASLLCTQIHKPRHAGPCALSHNKQMIGQLAIARALPRFNDLGHSETPIFFFDGTFSLLIWYVKGKNEENLSTRSLNFSKMHHQIPFLLAPRASVQQFQMPLKG